MHLADLAFFAKCISIVTFTQVSVEFLFAETNVLFCAAVGNFPLLCHLCGLHDNICRLLLRGDQGGASGGVPLHIQEALVLEEVSHHLIHMSHHLIHMSHHLIHMSHSQ